MIVVNQTFNISEQLHADWMAWMKSSYLPNLMAAGNFLHYKMFRLKSDMHEEGNTYAVQFMQSVLLFNSEQNDQLFQKFEMYVREKYGDQVLFFRTILEEVL